MQKGRKQKVKTAAEMDWLYEKRRYCYLKNGKAVRKIKRQMNRRWRRELKEGTIDELCQNDSI